MIAITIKDIMIILFLALAGDHQGHRIILDKGENFHLLHSLVRTVHKFEQRYTPVYQQFQIAGIGMAIQRRAIDHGVHCHNSLEQISDGTLLHVARFLQIALINGAAQTAVQLEFRQRYNRTKLVSQRSGQML